LLPFNDQGVGQVHYTREIGACFAEYQNKGTRSHGNKQMAYILSENDK
jgi:hypothetical protein